MIDRSERNSRSSDDIEKKGKIYNSVPNVSSGPLVPAKPMPSALSIDPDKKPVSASDDPEDDEWSAVPAFLRRSKLK